MDSISSASAQAIRFATQLKQNASDATTSIDQWNEFVACIQTLCLVPGLTDPECYAVRASFSDCARHLVHEGFVADAVICDRQKVEGLFVLNRFLADEGEQSIVEALLAKVVAAGHGLKLERSPRDQFYHTAITTSAGLVDAKELSQLFNETIFSRGLSALVLTTEYVQWASNIASAIVLSERMLGRYLGPERDDVILLCRQFLAHALYTRSGKAVAALLSRILALSGTFDGLERTAADFLASPRSIPSGKREDATTLVNTLVALGIKSAIQVRTIPR